jgi:hypothetical protein
MIDPPRTGLPARGGFRHLAAVSRVPHSERSGQFGLGFRECTMRFAIPAASRQGDDG